MCVVSMIHDWASKLPEPVWTPDLLTLYQDLLRRVEEIDKKLGQPDCESAEKSAFLKNIEERLARLEEKPSITKLTPTPLRGSGLLPSVVRIGDKDVPLAVVEWRAFCDGDLSVAGWNELPDCDREIRLVKAVHAMRAGKSAGKK